MNSNELSAMHSSLMDALRANSGLSNITKKSLAAFVRIAKEQVGEDKLLELGPAKLVEGALHRKLTGKDGKAMDDIDNNLNDNRKEAEQYLAGLLGMM